MVARDRLRMLRACYDAESKEGRQANPVQPLLHVTSPANTPLLFSFRDKICVPRKPTSIDSNPIMRIGAMLWHYALREQTGFCDKVEGPLVKEAI
jgi:hypothetical protein